jgi:hypothetical protein
LSLALTPIEFDPVPPTIFADRTTKPDNCDRRGTTLSTVTHFQVHRNLLIRSDSRR